MNDQESSRDSEIRAQLSPQEARPSRASTSRLIMRTFRSSTTGKPVQQSEGFQQRSQVCGYLCLGSYLWFARSVTSNSVYRARQDVLCLGNLMFPQPRNHRICENRIRWETSLKDLMPKVCFDTITFHEHQASRWTYCLKQPGHCRFGYWGVILPNAYLPSSLAIPLYLEVMECSLLVWLVSSMQLCHSLLAGLLNTGNFHPFSWVKFVHLWESRPLFFCGSS